MHVERFATDFQYIPTYNAIKMSILKDLCCTTQNKINMRYPHIQKYVFDGK